MVTNLGYGDSANITSKGFSSKSLDEAKKGLIFAGFLKILIPFIVVFQVHRIRDVYLSSGHPVFRKVISMFTVTSMYL
jgi:SSS family solute:Na+ symporter